MNLAGFLLANRYINNQMRYKHATSNELFTKVTIP